MTTTFDDTAKSAAPSFANGTRETPGFSNPALNASSFSDATKNTAAYEDLPKTQRVFGDIPIDELADYTFESVILMDGTQIKNVTFETLVDILWRNQTRN